MSCQTVRSKKKSHRGREAGKEPGSRRNPSVYVSCDSWLGVHVNSTTVPDVCNRECVCVCVCDPAQSGQGGV